MVENILQKYKKDIVMLDGILQWALNPTSKKSGYGFEKNHDYIINNLKLTHKLSIADAESITNKVEEELNEIIKKGQDIYDIRKRIKNEIKQNHFKIFFKFIKKRLKKSNEDIINLLNIYKNHPVGYNNLQAQFNAIYGTIIEENQIIQMGILKILYWISSGNIENSSSDPIIIPFLDKIIENLKLNWKLDKVDVKKYIEELKDNNQNDVINFLIKQMERNEIYIRHFNKGNSSFFSNLQKKGFIGIFDTPHQLYKDRLSNICISFLIKDELFNALQEFLEERNREQTQKVIKLLEYEIQNKKELNDKEIVRIAGIGIDELDDFKELIYTIPQESFIGNQEIANMATEAIHNYNNPTLYDLLKTLNFDIITARQVGKYLVEKKMIEKLSRIEGSEPSEASSKSRPTEIYCENCKTVLEEPENPKFCSLCGSSQLIEKSI